MATTTFSKNFQISKKDSDLFVDFMNEKVEPAAKRNFSSKMAHVKDYKDKFEGALKNS